MFGGGIKTVSRHEIQGQFDIVPIGTIGNSNPGQQAAIAQQVYSLAVNTVTQGLDRVMGYNINLGEAFKEVLNKADFLAARRIIQPMSQEQLQAMAQQQAQQQDLVNRAQANQGITAREARQLAGKLPYGEQTNMVS